MSPPISPRSPYFYVPFENASSPEDSPPWLAPNSPLFSPDSPRALFQDTNSTPSLEDVLRNMGANAQYEAVIQANYSTNQGVLEIYCLGNQSGPLSITLYLNEAPALFLPPAEGVSIIAWAKEGDSNACFYLLEEACYQLHYSLHWLENSPMGEVKAEKPIIRRKG